MRIIKHRTRRRALRNYFEDAGYYVVEGHTSVGTVEEAADIAIEVWSVEIKTAAVAPTLWDVYSRRAQ